MKRLKPKNVKVTVSRLTWREAWPNILVWIVLIGVVLYLIVR